MSLDTATMPKAPSGSVLGALIVLQLQHEPCTASDLATRMRLDTASVALALSVLQRAGLLQQDEGVWRVTPVYSNLHPPAQELP